MKAQVGKTYAQIQNNRCHWIFTLDGANGTGKLPEWNESHIETVDVTGKVPTVGDVWDGSSFSSYIPPPKTQAEINSEADRTIAKHRADAFPLLLDVLEKMTSGKDKADIKAINDQVKTEVAKKK